MDNLPTNSTDLPLPSWHRRLPIIAGLGVLLVVALVVGYALGSSSSQAPVPSSTLPLTDTTPAIPTTAPDSTNPIAAEKDLVRTNTLVETLSFNALNPHQVGRYSFGLPSYFQEESNNELGADFSSDWFNLRIVLGGVGYGAQCVEEKSSTMVDSPIGQVELRKFLGINSELPDCANQDHREAWVHLNYPETTKNDVLVLTWKNSEIDDAQADQLLNVILRSLSVSNAN